MIFQQAKKASLGFGDDKWCKERECERESVFMGIRHLRCYYVEIDGCICEIGSRFACHSIIHWKARHKKPEILSLNLQNGKPMNFCSIDRDRCLIQQLAAAQEKVKGWKSSRRPWHFPLPPLIFRVLGLFAFPLRFRLLWPPQRQPLQIAQISSNYITTNFH